MCFDHNRSDPKVVKYRAAAESIGIDTSIVFGSAGSRVGVQGEEVNMSLPAWRKVLASLAVMFAGLSSPIGPIPESTQGTVRVPPTGPLQDMDNTIRLTPVQDGPPTRSSAFPLEGSGTEFWPRAQQQTQQALTSRVQLGPNTTENNSRLERPAPELPGQEQQKTGTQRSMVTSEERGNSGSYSKEQEKESHQEKSESSFATAVQTIAYDTQVPIVEKYHILDNLLNSIISSMMFGELIRVKATLVVRTGIAILLLIVVASQYFAAGVSLVRLATHSILRDAFAQQADIYDRISTPVFNGLVCVIALSLIGVIAALVYAGFLAKTKSRTAQSILEHVTTAVIGLIGGVGVGRASVAH